MSVFYAFTCIILFSASRRSVNPSDLAIIFLRPLDPVDPVKSDRIRIQFRIRIRIQGLDPDPVDTGLVTGYRT